MKSFIVEKPWGSFEQFTHNETTTVKIISINKDGSLSLQKHAHRKEFIKIIVGNPKVTIGNNVIDSKSGDEFIIEIGQEHRMEAPIDEVKFLEISFGDFDEGDITRIEDKYGRN